jgi:hypothetical protein
MNDGKERKTRCIADYKDVSQTKMFRRRGTSNMPKQKRLRGAIGAKSNKSKEGILVLMETGEQETGDCRNGKLPLSPLRL